VSSGGEGDEMHGPTTADHPAPPLTGLPGEYFEWHRSDELRISRCHACQTWIHPPQYFCPGCASNDLRWELMSGRGSVYTWSVTSRPFHPSFADETPYIGAIVELDEGPRVFSMLRGVPVDAVAAGMRVRAEFEPRAEGTAVVVFVPAEEGGQA
jgi:uncharacterized OB-fold protein